MPSMVRTSIVARIVLGCAKGTAPPSTIVPTLTVGLVPSTGWTHSENRSDSISAVSARANANDALDSRGIAAPECPGSPDATTQERLEPR